MRGAIGLRLPNPNNISNATKQTLIPFSTSFPFGGGDASGGRGGGRSGGRGIGSPSTSDQVDFSARVIGKPNSDESKPDSSHSSFTSLPPGSAVGHGRGQGRGKPLPSPPSSQNVDSFQSLMYALRSSSSGRGWVADDPNRTPTAGRPDSAIGQSSEPKLPFFVERDESVTPATPQPASVSGKSEVEGDMHKSILSVLGVSVGTGRGKPMKTQEAAGTQENRHLKRYPVGEQRSLVAETDGEKAPKMSQEDAVKHALRTLSKGRGDGGRGREGLRGREGPGGGRGGRVKFRPEKFDKGQRGGRFEEEEEEDIGGLYLGDNADGEKLAKRLGPENMNQLAEIYEEIGERVLPSPMYDAFLDAFDVNCAVSQSFNF